MTSLGNSLVLCLVSCAFVVGAAGQAAAPATPPAPPEGSDGPQRP